MFGWFKERRKKAELIRRSLAINSDQELIVQNVPELAGMSDVEGMAYSLQALEAFRASCTPEQRKELQLRLRASQASWSERGMVMPYWGNLWVLRTYQASLSPH